MAECSEMANMIIINAGLMLAGRLKEIFGEATIILPGAGDNMTDLSFASTYAWLEANKHFRLRGGEAPGDYYDHHTQRCREQCCREASKWLHRIWVFTEHLESRELDFYPELEELRKKHESSLQGQTITLTHDADGKVIDGLAPLLRVFLEPNRKLWNWPI